MATFVTHPLLGAALADLARRRDLDMRRFVLATAMCHWLPDLDSVACLTSLDAHSPWAHRGFAHSLLAAVVIGALGAYFFERSARGGRRLALWVWFASVTALHGVVDALVAGSVGIAFFWPFDIGRYLFAWQPLVDAPVAMQALLGPLWRALLVESVFFGGLFALLKLGRLGIERRKAPALPEPYPEPS
ncbi:MAG: metal-dependent hydrolase [Planctomycetota bacterium]